MIKNVEKNKSEEEKNNSPYSRLIKVFKDLPGYNNENNLKYSSISNRASLLTSKKNSIAEEKNNLSIHYDYLTEIRNLTKMK